MTHKKQSTLALVILGIAILTCSAHASAQVMVDVVYLKNGSIIRGSVIELIPSKSIKIQTRDGNVFAYDIADVEKITKEAPPKTFYDVPDESHRYGFLSAMVGYGAKDGYNLGFGIRLGGIVSRRSYIGGVFVYHLGKSQDLSYYSFPPTTMTITVNSLYFGPEFGFEAEIAPGVSIRPYVNVGYFVAMASAAGLYGSSGSDGRLFVAPGMLFQFMVSTKGFVSIDNRFVVLTGQNAGNANAYGIFVGLGMLF